MKRTLALVAGLGLVLALGLVTSPAVSAQEEMASASLGSTSIDWQVSAAYDRAVLAVARPDGQVIRREFAAGQAIQFDLGRGPDGSYRWELTLAPRLSNDAKAQLAAARGTSAEAAVIAELKRRGELPAAPMVRSGGFQVAGGAIVPQDQTERPAGVVHTDAPRPGGGPTLAVRDQVIPDDLIVQGSICTGFDCVNNENFGFDTIRLKENNLRIKFEDTSVGTFPTNDWQLTANDSASGASSKFSIEDITGAKVPFTVTAGAATNSIFADSIGRIGLRTSTPVLDLHINTSNTPAIRLEQNSSGGFTAQTWDIAGNEANFFVRDVTGGSRLPFRIRPGAPTSSIDISADGDVGIGTAGPDNRVHILCNSAAAACGKIENSSATGFSGWEFTEEAGTTVANFSADNSANTFRLNSTNNFPTVFLTESTERVRIQSDGDVGIACNNPGSDLVIASGGACANPSSSINAGAGSFTTASSRTFKENLSPLGVPNILDRIAGIGVYNYDFINGPKDRIGLMAEDFHGIFGRGSDKYLNGDEVQMALWLAVQQLAARSEELRQDNQKLRQEIEELKQNH